ncbi:hypothetical protein AcW1_008543 [Taiwanofungus camphoratus]|nr:hypothetical protein AcV5_008829 [Antrodia cinnamomea]KAI0951516.1 hypothetical protein AcW1_008543 [Antrodia cinnamomea]
MTSGLLLDPMHAQSSEPTNLGPRFRPYASPDHHVTKGRYITSNDPRGYIPVYEYPLNGQWIMLDMDDGYVLWTGIWKALGNNKADIVKIIDSQPDLATQLRRVRGGYLKIQGTWMPYEIALRLARRVAWPIRYDLVPLFGPTFPGTCLSPDQPGYGQIVKPGTGKRRSRRNTLHDMSTDPRHDWTVISPALPPTSSSTNQLQTNSTLVTSRGSTHQFSYATPGSGDRQLQHEEVGSPVILHTPYVDQPYLSPPSSTTSSSYNYAASRVSPLDTGNSRYSPYPPSPLSSTVSRPATRQGRRDSQSSQSESIKLPSIHPPNRAYDKRSSETVTLPPISAMDAPREGRLDDSIAILKRLRSDDEDNTTGAHLSNVDSSSHRRRDIPTTAYKLSDASFPSARLPSVRSSSTTSSGSTLSPSLSPPTRDSTPMNTMSSRSLIEPPQLPRNWEQRSMAPPSLHQSDPLSRERMRHQRSAENSYRVTAAEDRTSHSGNRSWRPW